MLDSILKKYQGQKYFDFSIEGMSKVLFRLPRFVGWGENTISVGEHSLHVYALAAASEPENYELQLYSLIHDFPEAVYNDIPSYAKHNLGDEASVFLKTVDADVYQKLGLNWPLASMQNKVHALDMVALTREAEYVFQSAFDPVDWPIDDGSLPEVRFGTSFLKSGRSPSRQLRCRATSLPYDLEGCDCDTLINTFNRLEVIVNAK